MNRALLRHNARVLANQLSVRTILSWIRKKTTATE